MLQSLHIENVAVIEKTDISFGPGLTTLTGETGAGKSIVIDAINALLGERITRDVVRTGADKAYIAGVFEDLPASVVSLLNELELPPEEDGTLLIQRSITADGKGSCRVGGRPTTVSVLRQIGRMLVNIHGQHENQALLQPERHVEYLDRLGVPSEVIVEYGNAYTEYCRIHRAIKAATMDEQEKAFRTAQLEQQIAALEKAQIHPGEEAELTARREMARHSEKLAGALRLVRGCMEDDENGGTSGALTRLTDAVSALNTVSGVAPELQELATRLQSSLYEVQAVAEEAADFEDDLCFSEAELSAIEDRLAWIARLMKQHNVVNEQALLDKLEAMQNELDSIQSSDEYVAELERQSDAARKATIAAAQKLTEARKLAAVRFEQDVCQQLTFMDMPHVRLAVSIEPTALTSMGGDKVEFLISSNPGEPPKSIAKTASGGELSRIMLALKSVLARVDDIDTLVFDEVDSGISGHAASKVGTLMRGIAGNRQVLCVTHLAQIAACGHSHLLVAKSVEGGRTYTKVAELDEPARLGELARIMGGAVTDTTLSAAEELRRRAVT
ncbi:MAG: DNA repair protein RecN [Ruminococcaceae bacterium]|nr:DNA repair protein RecN [Oscillospiraceae bacterium]